MNYFQKKKLAFMSIVNRIKGFIRTITGELPLTLEGCVDEESIIDYTLYGQSVQNGTPTPETPVEVESVGEYDETTGKYKIPIKVSGKNLFDINKFITLDGNSTYYEINENGELVQKASDYRGNTVLPTVAVLPIGTYIISGFGSWSTFRVVNKTTGEGIGYSKFTLTEPTEIAVKWWAKGGTVIGKPMLREGTTATGYEPYHEPITTNIYLDEPLGDGQCISYKKDGLPNLPTFKGTSIISADTTIQPSNVEITYYSNVKE